MSDFEAFGAPETGNRHSLGRRNFEDGDVRLLVCADDARRGLSLPTGDHHGDFLGFLDDVLIGEDVARFGHDEPRTRHLISPVVHLDDRFDVDDPRRDALGHVDDTGLERRVGRGVVRCVRNVFRVRAHRGAPMEKGDERQEGGAPRHDEHRARARHRARVAAPQSSASRRVPVTATP